MGPDDPASGRETRRDVEDIRAVVNGDRQAYAGLVRRHQPHILGFCLSWLSDAAQAEDAAQEVFLKAFKSLRAFRGDSSFSTWLHRIAANHCLDLLRKKSRERSESWEALLERDGEKLHRLFAAPAWRPRFSWWPVPALGAALALALFLLQPQSDPGLSTETLLLTDGQEGIASQWVFSHEPPQAGEVLELIWEDL